jgi:hypothetical protein
LKKHVHYYHTEEGQAERKREEQRIAKLLDLASIPYKREHQVTTTCVTETRKFVRIDFVLQSSVIVMVEVDEDQHADYSCDLKRMADTLAALQVEGNTLPIVFLRYNPHAFKVDGKTKRTLKKDREAKLLEVIRDALSGKLNADRQVAVQYLFYDTAADGELEIWKNPDYDERFKKDHCLTPITSGPH